MNGTAAVVAAAELDLAGAASLSAPGQFGDLDAETASAAVEEPLLVVVAENDQPYATSAPIIADGSGGDLLVLSGAAHGTNLFGDHGAALTAALLDFVATAAG